jgi:hypothetical protein
MSSNLLFLSGLVAFRTILKIIDALVQMLLTHFPFIMFMAAIAGIGCETGRVAGRAGCSAAMIEREGMLAGELCRSPGCGAMTGGAVGAKLASMGSRFRMAGNAGCA